MPGITDARFLRNVSYVLRTLTCFALWLLGWIFFLILTVTAGQCVITHWIKTGNNFGATRVHNYHSTCLFFMFQNSFGVGKAHEA